MNLIPKIHAFLRIIRPELPLAAGICVVLGELLALGDFPPVKEALAGLACGFLLAGSAMVFNDYFDLEVDRVNSPDRPLPAGLITPHEAVLYGAALGIAGAAAAWMLNAFTLIAAGVMWVVGFLYNWRFKSLGLWGNMLVSLNVGMTFIVGGIGVAQINNPAIWFFGLIAFLFDLAEEIAGDTMDMEGDRKRGSRSIALTAGRKTALRISAGLFMLVVLLSLTPVVLIEWRWEYRLVVILIDLVIVIFTMRLVRSRTPSQGRQAMRVMYLTASSGLLLILIINLARL